MTYNPYLDVGLQLTHGVSPYFHAEVPEPCEMTTAAEVRANDAWLEFRATQWAAAWRDDLTVEEARDIETRIENEWFGENDHD